jgi:hypothetical protein
MSSIVINPDNYIDIVIAYLLDHCIHEDKITKGQEPLRKLVDKLNRAGIRPFLLQQYLESDANIRYKYKMIRDALDGKSRTQQSIVLAKKMKKETRN